MVFSTIDRHPRTSRLTELLRIRLTIYAYVEPPPCPDRYPQKESYFRLIQASELLQPAILLFLALLEATARTVQNKAKRRNPIERGCRGGNVQ